MYQIAWQHCSPINRYANLPPYWPQNNHLPPHFWLHKLLLSTFSFENPGVPVRALHQQTKSCTPHPFPCAHIRSSTAITSLIRQREVNQGSHVLVIVYLVFFCLLSQLIWDKLKFVRAYCGAHTSKQACALAVNTLKKWIIIWPCCITVPILGGRPWDD